MKMVEDDEFGGGFMEIEIKGYKVLIDDEDWDKVGV